MHTLTGHAHERKPGATTGSCSIIDVDAKSRLWALHNTHAISIHSLDGLDCMKVKAFL